MTARLAMSCEDRARSPRRSQMFCSVVEPPSQDTLPELCETLSIILDQV